MGGAAGQRASSMPNNPVISSAAPRTIRVTLTACCFARWLCRALLQGVLARTAALRSLHTATAPASDKLFVVRARQTRLWPRCTPPKRWRRVQLTLAPSCVHSTRTASGTMPTYPSSGPRRTLMCGFSPIYSQRPQYSLALLFLRTCSLALLFLRTCPRIPTRLNGPPLVLPTPTLPCSALRPSRGSSQNTTRQLGAFRYSIWPSANVAVGFPCLR